MNDITTTDLARFGHRERVMLRDILDAWTRHGLPDDFDDTEVRPMLNMYSGYVFLTNQNYDVAVLGDDDQLESFYNSPYEGHEGTFSELLEMFDPDTWNGQDAEWLAELAEARGVEIGSVS